MITWSLIQFLLFTFFLRLNHVKRHLENVYYIHRETKTKREVINIYKNKRAIE